MGNVLWFIPTEISIKGKTTFRSDLLRNTVIATDAAFFNKDPFNISFGRGSADLSYQPIAFKGAIDATELRIGFNFGEIGLLGDPQPIEPLESAPPACDDQAAAEDCVRPVFDGLPEVELYDLTTSSWRRLPHMTGGSRYAVTEPGHFVDPATGSVLVRLINSSNDSVGFNLDLAITGDVE
jgi:hypothetical protein